MEITHEKVTISDLFFFCVTFNAVARVCYYESEGLQGQGLFSSLTF